MPLKNLPPEKLKWVILAILTLIWGSSFFLIKKSLETYTPYQVGALRVLLAGLLLSPLAVLNTRKFPKKRIGWVILAALSGNFIPMFLFPIAETQLDSSIAGIINSMMPIFVILIGALFWKMKTTRRQAVGILISFAGACMLMLTTYQSGDTPLWPIVILLIATVLYAVSSTTVGARLRDIPAKILSGFVFFYVLSLPSLIALVFSGFFADFHGTAQQWVGLGYVSLLSVFGTGLAMLLNYRLLNISSPLFASTVTLLMPIVAVLWGVLDGEKLSVLQYLGGAVILAGLVFMRRAPGTQKTGSQST